MDAGGDSGVALRRTPEGGEAARPLGEDGTAQLQKLAALHTQGVLTAEEFAAAKAKILGI